MALSDHVSLTITAGTVGVARAGFGVPLILSVTADWAERVRTYTDIEGVAEDFATTSPEYLAASAMFSQEPHPEQIMIGRALGQPTQRYQINVTTVTTGATYGVNVEGDGVTSTEVRYTPAADITFTAEADDETLTSADHGMEDGDGPYRLSNSGGALPSGLAADTNYWIIYVTDNTFQLAASRADALAGTEVTFTTDGTGTHTLRRSQNDVICAQLVQGLNDVVGKNYTAAQTVGAGETDYVVATADAAGDWFSLEVTNVSLLKVEQTHVEPATTLATDIAAIRQENDTWYALYTLFNSDPYVKAAAAAIEPLKKIYVGDLSNSESATLADGGGDTGDDLQTLNYDRTATMYHPSPYRMAGAAWLGTRLPYDPGSATWKFAQPDGVPAVNTTATHATNLVAKNINFVETTAGLDIVREGVMVGGEFIDKIRDLDWLENDLTAAVFETLAGVAKVPFTDAGIAMIECAVRGSLLRAVELQIIDPDFTITVPKARNVSAANRALRLLPDIKFECRMQGAIHKVRITGVVSV